ncbi:MAG: SDR family oxidoreductase [Microgenomates group bacterium]
MDNGLKPSIIVTGSNGLIGSKFHAIAKDIFTVVPAEINNLENPVDITKRDQVFSLFEKVKPTALVHFAAFTNVTAAWEQSGDKNGIAYQVNVLGTENITAACEAFETQLIHVSTAYVFDGSKDKPYLETDATCPIEWYGTTKALAEETVQNSSCKHIIFRIDQPFRSDDFPKLDVVRRIVNGIITDSLYPQFTDHFFSPTYIDDFVQSIFWAITNSKTGLYHCTTNTVVSDYEFAQLIRKHLEKTFEIQSSSVVDYLKKTARPYQVNTSLNSDKLRQESNLEILNLPQALEKVIINLDALAPDATQ